MVPTLAVSADFRRLLIRFCTRDINIFPTDEEVTDEQVFVSDVLWSVIKIQLSAYARGTVSRGRIRPRQVNRNCVRSSNYGDRHRIIASLSSETKMNTPQSNKKNKKIGRSRMGVLNESASPTNTETLSSQEATKFVLVWIKHLI